MTKIKKVLFVSILDETNLTGGTACSQRNLDSLIEIYGKDNVETFYLKPAHKKKGLKNSIMRVLSRLSDILSCFMLGMDYKKVNLIYGVVEQKNIDVIFWDSSLFGCALKLLRKRFPQIKSIVFFHNIEYIFAKEYIRITKDYIRAIWIFLSYINERNSCRYADKIFVLNKRDLDALNVIYSAHADAVIPMSFLDKRNKVVLDLPQTNVLTLGFVGSYFYANVDGIKWFLKNVFPNLKNAKLIIAGMNMFQLKQDISVPPNVEILSNVAELQQVYDLVDVMIMPIFSGSGMKVKTAEALMHGKFILGTQEAFQGYDINSDCGIECNSKHEFINSLNNLQVCRFNTSSRLLYEEKYSYQATIKLFKDGLNHL